MAATVLVHGGLWDDMDAQRFWHGPGIVAAMSRRGYEVVAPDRLVRPSGWDAEVEHLAARLPQEPMNLLAGSNGCSVAARLASVMPDRVRRLVLAWPATANDLYVDARQRADMVERGATTDEIDALLRGETLRGLTDDELAGLVVPVGVLPSLSQSRNHQHRTVDALTNVVPGVRRLAGCPEPPRPDFPTYLDSFLDTVTEFID